MGGEIRVVELGECVAKVIDHRGRTPKKLGSDWVDEGVPAISAKNVRGGRLIANDSIRFVTNDVYRRWMTNGDVQRGDCLLVSEGATLGECMYWDEDYPIVLSQRLFCLRAKPDVLYPRFLYAYMNSHSFQSEVIARATGTSVSGLRQTEVLKLKIQLPPIQDQRVIGDTLYNLNKKIELNRRMNETLESMARALFKSWFVDFDPVRAKADGRRKPGKSLPGLPEHLYDLFPDRLVPSGLGEIPEGWVTCSIGEDAHLSRAGLDPGLYPDEIFDHFSIPAFDEGRTPKTELGGEIKSNKHMVLNGCVLLSKLNPRIPRVWLPMLGKERRAISSTEFLVVLSGSGWTREFLYSLLSSDRFSADFSSLVTGTSGSHQRVKPQAFLNLEVVMPPREIVEVFSEIVSPKFSRITEARAESLNLMSIRDALLPRLISGDLKVPDLNRRSAGESR